MGLLPYGCATSVISVITRVAQTVCEKHFALPASLRYNMPICIWRSYLEIGAVQPVDIGREMRSAYYRLLQAKFVKLLEYRPEA